MYVSRKFVEATWLGIEAYRVVGVDPLRRYVHPLLIRHGCGSGVIYFIRVDDLCDLEGGSRSYEQERCLRRGCKDAV